MLENFRIAQPDEDTRPVYCSNKTARLLFYFNMHATSFTAITLEKLSAVATLFLGLEGHRT
jgi:hypothetical protein